MHHPDTTFLSGCSPAARLCYVAKQDDDLAARGVNNSVFLIRRDGEWLTLPTYVGWPAVAAATVSPPGQNRQLVFIAPDGDFYEIDARTLQETVGMVPDARYALAALSAIDEVVYACGMGREVLQRDAPGAWRRIGPPLGDDETGVIGFEDLAGFSADELYAVGWQGEIWLSEQGRWRRIDSPVSANLNAACCAADGWVYVVGDGGAMLRGRRDEWSVLDTGRQENLLDVCAHAGEVFVVSDFRILRLEGEALRPETRFAQAAARPGTCLRLLPSSDGVYAMGPKDLFLFQAGQWDAAI